MRKLLLASLLLFSAPAWANTIALHTNISADNAISGVNSNFSTIANVINGTIEGSTDSGATVSNIKADSVYEINMADDANPRVRDSELFNITTDTQSGATLTQGTVRESGCDPADDTDLTSDVSACVFYVNGYRVSKAATSVTYTATRDCYLDLSQSGVYTNTCVTVGAAAPAVAANSGRLAKVVTNGTEITSVTALYTTRVPGLIIPAHYRDGLKISYDSSTTVLVGAGTAEINSSMVSKSTETTLTLSTAGDYAGGSSLRAVNTYGYVGMDSSGNLKLHTTAPTHDNYAVSTTAGKLRYATWSSTVYRILGWFWMNNASSGSVETGAIGNINEGDVTNHVYSADATNATVDTASTDFIDLIQTRFYSSGGKTIVRFGGNFAGSVAQRVAVLTLSIDGVGFQNSVTSGTSGLAASDGVGGYQSITGEYATQLGRGTHTCLIRWRTDAATLSTRENFITIEEK